MPTKLLVVRHGHVEGIAPERFRGRRDLPLTPTGIAQARALSRRLAGGPRPDAVYASPLSRTVATAETVAEPFGLTVVRDPDLIDIDYGEWHGLSREEACATWPEDVDLWYRAPQLANIPAGESLARVLARVNAALASITRRHRGGRAVLVAHESVNRVILLHALDLPLSHYWRLEQSPCCINELDFLDDRFCVLRLNDAAHLE
jgi:broad specificity phosphatase PhoE